MLRSYEKADARCASVDVGAMRFVVLQAKSEVNLADCHYRFPTIPFMLPVLKLFKELDMFKDEIMIKYDYAAPHTFQYYNGIRYRNGDPTPKTDVFEGTPLPQSLRYLF